MKSSVILYVDQDEAERNHFCEFMADFGLAVDVARSGKEALAMAVRKNYQVVLTESELPRMTGLQLISGIHKYSPYSSFILFGDEASDITKIQPELAALILKNLGKPLELTDLAKMLDQVIATRQQAAHDEILSFSKNIQVNILLIENDLQTIDLLRQIISRLADETHNYQLIVAGCLSEAMERLDFERYSLILSVLDLPDSQGLETVSRILTATDVPLIVLTHANQDPLAQQAIRVGAQDYLDKSLIDAISTGISLQNALESHLNHLRYESLLRDNADGVMVVDMDNEILFANAPAAALFSNSVQGLVGEIFEYPLQNNAKFELRTSPDRLIEVNVAETGWNRESAFLLSLCDIYAHKELEDKLQYLAYHDAVTGLANKSLLLELTEQAIVKYKRSKLAFGLIMVEFEGLNSDSKNSQNELLKAVAHVLSFVVRESDSIAHTEGNQLVILAYDLADSNNIASLCKNILGSLKSPLLVLGKAVQINTSIGVATYPQNGETPQQLLKNCEITVDLTHKAGGGTFRFYDAQVQALTVARSKLENELHKALKDDEFEIYYQPQFDHSRIIGAEALLRWNHPQKGLIQPLDFIPVLNEMGLMIALEKVVLKKVCNQLSLWREKFNQDLTMTINLTKKTLLDEDFLEQIDALLTEFSLPANSLEFDIKESVLTHQSVVLTNNLAGLHERQIKIALDDFGTGVSSISHLLKFSWITSLKLDREFIRGMDRPRNCAIFDSVIQLGHALKLQVVADGVETQQQLQQLKLWQCDSFKGFIFSPAVPVAKWDELFGRELPV